uniref:Uncharacterized protein n=1 Tax=Leersia perrieri TaxID=77586 RepID=A0A0D9WQ93_9ORYZ
MIYEDDACRWRGRAEPPFPIAIPCGTKTLALGGRERWRRRASAASVGDDSRGQLISIPQLSYPSRAADLGDGGGIWGGGGIGSSRGDGAAVAMAVASMRWYSVDVRVQAYVTIDEAGRKIYTRGSTREWVVDEESFSVEFVLNSLSVEFSWGKIQEPAIWFLHKSMGEDSISIAFNVEPLCVVPRENVGGVAGSSGVDVGGVAGSSGVDGGGAGKGGDRPAPTIGGLD